MTHPPTLEALPVQRARGRLLIMLVIDTSSSMADNGGIVELNNALSAWRAELHKNDYVAQVGEIAVVTFGRDYVTAIDPSGNQPGQAARPFVPARMFNPAPLAAGGVTPMTEALEYGLRLIGERKHELSVEGLPLANRPLVYLMTDGVPTDATGHRTENWRHLIPLIRQQETGNHLLFFAIGVKGADQGVLRELAPKSSFSVDSLDFSTVLQLVSSSIEAVTQNAGGRDQPAEQVYDDLRERHAKHERMQEFLRQAGFS